ncbi:MAG: 3-hydroxylacyl-ACP dehydratase [Pseudomonadota bacterium]|nr:3-hydroxylacyl-ACP dehydratase [Pseudomonadota bacterium]
MCLLDEVVHWNEVRISCRIGGHRDPNNPLRAAGRLGVVCGIEYAAQTMAVHGALSHGAGSPAAGFLAAVRNVQMLIDRLDDVAGALICDAVRAAGDHVTALYDFELRSSTVCLLRGRATVVLQGNAESKP